MIYWYHFYLKHLGVSGLSKKFKEYVFGKALSRNQNCIISRARYVKIFKNRKTLHGHLPPKIIAELRPWDLVHVDLIGPYSKSIIQHHTGGAMIKNHVSLT